MSLRLNLLIIDGQKDFCDPGGSLYIPGADNDCERLCQFIPCFKWKKIFTTYDTHHFYSIWHPIFWQNKEGKHPLPFTVLTTRYLDEGEKIVVAKNQDGSLGDEEYLTTNPEDNAKATSYVAYVQKLTIWPPHCLIGTDGWCLMPQLMAPLLEWEAKANCVEKIVKGTNRYIEHYSPFRAEMVDATDKTTLPKRKFIKELLDADLVVITGWASSHCLGKALIDLSRMAESIKDIRKIVLLTDTTRPVPGYKHLADRYINAVTVEREEAYLPPIRTATCEEFLKNYRSYF